VNATVHSIIKALWLDRRPLNYPSPSSDIHSLTNRIYTCSSQSDTFSKDYTQPCTHLPANTHTQICHTTIKLVIPTLSPMLKPNNGGAPIPLKHISSPHTSDHSQLSTIPPSYLKTCSHTYLSASNATAPTIQKPYVPLLSRTSPQLQNYSTIMWEHQSTQRVMSPGLQPV